MAFNQNFCHLFYKTFSSRCVLKECLRTTHFKFRATQLKQQTIVLNKFFNRNQNILNKILENKPKIVSKGSPNRKEIDSKGMDKRYMTRRMTVLNKQLMQIISDVLSTEEIGLKIQELQIRITQVKVSPKCDLANIYWVSKCNETNRVAQELDQMKGKLHSHIIDRNLMNSVPWIQFVLDVNENKCLEVERVLQRCDFGPNFKPSDSTLFETPYESVNKSDDKPNNKSKDKSEGNQNAYEFYKILKPNDMQMNCLGLDYESIINNVLINLNKSRAQHRSFNAIADPLPPPNWSDNSVVPSEDKMDAIYNTDERIKAMKTFLIENRKKKEKMSREMKRRIILQEMRITTNLTDAFDSYQELEEEEIDHQLNEDNTFYEETDADKNPFN